MVVTVRVEVAWEGLEETASTSETVPRVFHYSPAALRKKLKVIRLKAEKKRDSYSGMGFVCDHSLVLGGVPISEVGFLVFLTWSFCVGR